MPARVIFSVEKPAILVAILHFVQVRVCTRMGVQLVSTDFKSHDYYSNIRRAITAGYFMQVHHACVR